MASQSSTIHPTRLRQIALVAHDLDRARNLITHVFSVPVIFEDPMVAQWGLKNFLVPIGGEILEVVAPFKQGTTAGRLLEKKGDGGYMIIMQTGDAQARKEEIERRGKGKAIFTHPFQHSYKSWGGVKDEGYCVQYHPKGVKGGMMPELDSHTTSEWNQNPLMSRFSPWHPCGSDYDGYVKEMKNSAALHLLGCTLRLGPGDEDVNAAAQQWSDTFGIPVTRNELAFTNSRMAFVKGEQGKPEGLLSVTVGVDGKARMQGILDRASKAGLCGDGWFEMVGVRWYLVLLDDLRAHI